MYRHALRYSNDDIEAITELVALHLRFHTYQMGWTDSAVRRYVRDAGPLLAELNVLTRCDCTTRNERKALVLSQRMDELEERIVELAEREEIASIRPELDGTQVMEQLGVGPGPIVGKALASFWRYVSKRECSAKRGFVAGSISGGLTARGADTIEAGDTSSK